MNAVNGLNRAVAAGLGYTATAPAAQRVSSPIPALHTTWTIEGWVRLSANHGHTLYAVANTTGVLHLFVDNSGYAAVAVSGTSVAIHSTTNVRDRGNHALAVSYDGTTLRLYVDGVLAGSQAASLNLTGTTGYMGSAVTLGIGAPPMTGTLDEVAIYPTALSAARVLAHYQAGKATSFAALESVTVNQGGGVTATWDNTLSRWGECVWAIY